MPNPAMALRRPLSFAMAVMIAGVLLWFHAVVSFHQNDNDATSAAASPLLLSMDSFAAAKAREEETSILLRGGRMSTTGVVVLPDELRLPYPRPGAPPYRKWAYVYLIAGCNPAEAERSYLGFLYNVLNSAYVLKHMPGEGVEPTSADIIVMVQMSYLTDQTELPKEHKRWLDEMGVNIYYLPKPTSEESFDSIQMAKFTILDMTQYTRVMFLDSDVMPLTSLDYIFDMSEPLDGDEEEPVIRPNFVHTAWSSPSNGGMFMLEPKPGYYKQLQEIIRKQNEKEGEFDEVQGWGHAFQKDYNDYWHNVDDQPHYLWDFHAADVDQGLLYYWVKYVLRDVSILNARTGIVEHFVKDDTSPTTIRMTDRNQPFQGKGYVSSVMAESAELKAIPLPARNFYHATGSGKPWKDKHGHHPRPIFIPDEFSDIESRYVSWFGVLWMVAEKLEINIEVEKLNLL